MRHSLIKGTLYLSMASLIFMLSGYGVNIWLGRKLGPEAYGLYGVIISLVTVINLTQTSGLPFAVSKYIASNKGLIEEIYKKGFYIQAISTCVASILFYILSGWISILLHDDRLIPYLQFSSLVFPVYGVYALMSGYYNGRHLFRRQAIINILYSLSKITCIVFLVSKFHLYGVIAGFILSPIVALFGGLKFPQKTQMSFPYKKLIFFSLPLIGFALFSNLLQTTDIFFVKALTLSKNSAGYYTAAQNISKIPFFAFSALSSVLFPAISKVIGESLHKEAGNLINKTIRLLFLLLVPLTVLISTTSKQLLILIYSSKYIPGYSALSILTISMSLLTIFTILGNILNGAGKSKSPFFISLLGVCITAVLCRLFIPTWGLVGAATATFSGSFIAVIIIFFLMHKKFYNPFPYRSIIKIILAGIIMYCMATILSLPMYLLIFKYGILLCTYFLVLILMSEISQQDIEVINIFAKNSSTKR